MFAGFVSVIRRLQGDREGVFFKITLAANQGCLKFLRASFYIDRLNEHPQGKLILKTVRRKSTIPGEEI